MLPNELQAIMAKILFFVFATIVLCFSKAKGKEVRAFVESPVSISSSASFLSH